MRSSYPYIFTNTVKNNNGIVDRITDNRKDSCNKYLINLKSNSKNPYNREGCNHEQSIMGQGHDRASAKLPFSETKQNINEDRDQR